MDIEEYTLPYATEYDFTVKTIKPHPKNLQLAMKRSIPIAIIATLAVIVYMLNNDTQPYVIVVLALCLVATVPVFIAYGRGLGIMTSPQVKELAAKVSEEGDTELLKSWAVYKPYVDYWYDNGMTIEEAFRWIVVINQLKMSFDDLYELRSFVIELHLLGMSAERFKELYVMGINNHKHFLTIAGNDIDDEIVRKIYPLVSSIERRINRTHDDYVVLGLS